MKIPKLRPLSQLTDLKELDSVKHQKSKSYDNKNPDLLTRCQTSWDSLHGFRSSRDRAMRYTYGDQWSDTIKSDGKLMTEKAHIQAKGNVPLTNNLIRSTVNNVVGTFAKQQEEPTCIARDRDEKQLGEMMSITLQCNWQLNRMPEILSNIFEEYCISGMAIAREAYDYRYGKKDAYTDVCNPNYIFFSSAMIDPRHWDIDLIGQIHDISYNELISKFVKNDTDIQWLKTEFRRTDYNTFGLDKKDTHSNNHLDFYIPYDNTKYRIYEIWSEETKPRYRCHDRLTASWYKIELDQLGDIIATNSARVEEGDISGIAENEIPTITHEYFVDKYWYYQYLTPNGTILEEGETPYFHKSHPYSMKLYPFVNGEIHSFVSNIIDQQRYINRMITLNDFIIRASAKGVTMVPLDCIPDDMTKESFAQEWVETGGIMFYNAKAGVSAPQQFSQNLTNIGTNDMLKLQIQLMQDIGGVHGATQGKTPHAGTSAALYAQQSANGTTSLMNLLGKFRTFEEDAATKKVKVIQQYYTDKKVVNIAGVSYSSMLYYDPVKVRDVEFDLSIKQSASTPAYRMMANDFLMQLWQSQAINVEQLLKHGDFPFADNILQDISVQKEQLEKQQQMQGFSPDVMQQVSNGSNPQKEALLRQAMQQQQLQ